MPQMQDQSLDLLICNTALYHCPISHPPPTFHTQHRVSIPMIFNTPVRTKMKPRREVADGILGRNISVRFVVRQTIFHKFLEHPEAPAGAWCSPIHLWDTTVNLQRSVSSCPVCPLHKGQRSASTIDFVMILRGYRKESIYPVLTNCVSKWIEIYLHKQNIV